MSAEELVRAIEQSGGALAIVERGDRLHYRLPANAGVLLDELRRMKPKVIPVLRRRLFLHLVPFLGKRVWTPAGPGKLVRLEDYASVEFGDASKGRWYDPTAVIPYA
jgi:hypothetical protein